MTRETETVVAGTREALEQLRREKEMAREARGWRLAVASTLYAAVPKTATLVFEPVAAGRAAR